MQASIDTMQKQINAVSASIPQEVKKQADVTNGVIQGLQASLKQQVALLNSKISQVQAQSQQLIGQQAASSKQQLEKVRTDLLAGLQALQGTVKKSHDDLTAQIQKLAQTK